MVSIRYTLRLIALKSEAQPESFLSHLLDILKKARALSTQPIVIGYPKIWTLPPHHIAKKALVSHQWDLMLLSPASSAIENCFKNDDVLSQLVSRTFTMDTQVSANALVDLQTLVTRPVESRVLPEGWQDGTVPQSAINFDTRNNGEPSGEPSDVIPFGHELATWCEEYYHQRGPHEHVTMLNFFAYNPDGGRERSGKYFLEFVPLTRERNGTEVLITGECQGSGYGEEQPVEQGQQFGWERFGLVRYSSILHFAEMLANEDVQNLQKRLRVGAIRDQAILCVGQLELL